MSKSIFEQVFEFTNGTYNAKDRPIPLTEDKVKFIIRMVLSECLELANTVTDDPQKFVGEAMTNLDIPNKRTQEEIDILQLDVPKLIDEQSDAFIDIIYYICDTMARHGINGTESFDVVHEANMSKKFPDGTFHIRADGKIEKPSTFLPPNTLPIIRKMLREGSWNK